MLGGFLEEFLAEDESFPGYSYAEAQRGAAP
jgi:hypothetical protein